MLFRRFAAKLLTGPLAFLLAGVLDVAAALATFGVGRRRRR
jgi:hypothetical protein